MRTRVLFLCANGAVLGPMAVAYARHRFPKLEIDCSGLHPDEPDPLVQALIRKAGLSTEPILALPEADVFSRVYDIVIALNPSSIARTPLLPGCPIVLRWNFPEHSDASPDMRSAMLETILDRVRAFVNVFFDHGYLEALNQSRNAQNRILESISDGVLAHDLERRLVFFNRSAEAITGFRRQAVLGRDCHTVFDGRFCGGKCIFCNQPPPDFDERHQEMQIHTRTGEGRLVAATQRPLLDVDGKRIGLVMSFRDQTREHDLARRMEDIQTFSGIIGRDARMQSVYALIRDVADASIPVLIHGESGTGKELVAAAIHNESQRADNLFVPVNCGALPEGLLESELFGHVKGAFTGAVRDKKGRFELADGGTIFLDEIGDISPAMQVRLLRVLQEGRFERVGGESTQQVNVRVISATHRDLQQEIADGRFREDLFYRLNVVPIHLPPLRERRVDIPMLAEHFLNRYAREQARDPVRISDAAMDRLLEYSWPGNVRELQNWIQFALVKCHDNTILPQHFPPHEPHPDADEGHDTTERTRFRRGRRRLTVERVRDVLAMQEGNRGLAAETLGVSRATLYRFFAQHPEILGSER